MVDIDPQDEVLRRIFSYHLKPDNTISSAAFMTRSRKPDPECSVSLSKVTDADTLLAGGPPGQAAVAFTSGFRCPLGSMFGPILSRATPGIV